MRPSRTGPHIANSRATRRCAVPQHIEKSAIKSILVVIALTYLGAILTAAQASVTRALLLLRQKELQKQVARLKMSRINLMAAFELERRRIERDLHDGVQQRLVALSITLGIAELEIEQVARQSAPVGALREAVSAAHNQAEAALADLRNTVRGIHPHVLADFGLAEAIREITGRLPLNSDVTVAVDQRLPEQVELCAYFFVSEALTNAVRHSGASTVRVTASLVNDELVVEVRDNGNGGAELGSGSGLVGLRERAEALNGHVSVESPRDGPTSLRLRVPFSAPNGRE
jgi:signal transduction histidine kinase